MTVLTSGSPIVQLEANGFGAVGRMHPNGDPGVDDRPLTLFNLDVEEHRRVTGVD